MVLTQRRSQREHSTALSACARQLGQSSMKKYAALIMFAMVASICVPVQANDTKRVYITESHIYSLIGHTLQAEQLKILNIEGVPQMLAIGIDPGQFRVVYYLRKSATERTYITIWIAPRLENGQIFCSITQFQVNGQNFKGDALTKSNPYLHDLDATPYCNLFLTPFLRGYGSGSQVVSLKLQNNMVWLDIGGTIVPDAPPPVVVAQCKVLVGISFAFGGTINLRSAPSLDAPVLETMFDGTEGRLLGWNAGWVKIDQDGQIGWLSKPYAHGGMECLADYFRVTDAWYRSDEP